MRPQIVTVCTVLFACSCLFTEPSTAAVLRVNLAVQDSAHDGSSWPNAYNRVGDACAAAVAGDEIWVAAGVYHETITLPDGASLFGGFSGTESDRSQRDYSRNDTVLDAENYGTPVKMFGGTVDGFTIRNANYDPVDPKIYGGGIYSARGYAVVTHNVITNNWTVGYGGGVFVTSGEVAYNVVTNNLSWPSGGGITCCDRETWVHHNYLSGNHSGHGTAIECFEGKALVFNNVVTGEMSAFSVVAFQAAQGLIANNTIVNNRWEDAAGTAGIEVYRSQVDVVNNIVARNWVGIWDPSPHSNLDPGISSNDVYDNSFDNYRGFQDATGVFGNISRDPLFVDEDAGDFRLKAGSPCIDAGQPNAVIGVTDYAGRPRDMGASVDIGAFESEGSTPPPYALSRVYLSPNGQDANRGDSWDSPLRTLDAALRVLSQGGEIWLREGDYGLVNITLPKGARLYGGFSGSESSVEQRPLEGHPSILSTRRSDPLITVQEGADTATVVDRLVLRSSPPVLYQTSLPLMVCVNASPMVVQCQFDSNNTGRRLLDLTESTASILGCSFQGGSSNSGIATVSCTGGAPRIADTDFSNTNGLSLAQSSARIEGCTFTSGVTSGVAIKCASSPATILRNRFGGAVFVTGSDASPSIIANSFIRVSPSAISCSEGASPRIANNLIAQSTSGAISVNRSSPTIVNNTIVRNGGANGAISCTLSPGTIIWNNVIAFNASGVRADSTGVSVRNNAFYRNVRGDTLELAAAAAEDGNLFANPVLAGAPYGDYHLQPSSPCRDAGLDEAVEPGDMDADGGSRIVGTRVDIGAYESDGTSRLVKPVIIRLRPGGDDTLDGASWSTAKATLAAAITALPDTGGDVWVSKGTFKCPVINKSVRLYGGFAGWETSLSQRALAANPTVLKATEGTIAVQFLSGATDAVVDGFTIRDGAWGVATSGLVTVAHNVILFNTGSNWSNNGGISISGGAATIENNEISANGGPEGAGLHVSNAFADVRNNTIVRNGPVGAKIMGTGSARFTNNIIAFNASGIVAEGKPSVTFSRNCLYGNSGQDAGGLPSPVGADGNIGTDPRFVREDYGDFRLSSRSPCIDTGDGAAVSPGDLDVTGAPRKQGVNVDIGAYESDRRPIAPVPDRVVRVKTDGDDRNDGTTWQKAKRTVQAALAAVERGGDVWVAAGTYAGPLAVSPYASLLGGFPARPGVRSVRNAATNVTVIRSADSQATVRVVGGDASRIFDGFAVTNDGVGESAGPALISANGERGYTALTVKRGSVNFSYGKPRLSRCRFQTQVGLTQSSPIIARCEFRGGLNLQQCTSSVTSSVFTGCTGYAIRVFAGIAWIVNNSIAGNGTGIVAQMSSTTLQNNVIAFNEYGVRAEYAPIGTFSSNCVYGNATDFVGMPDPTGKYGNISADPRFLDGEMGRLDIAPDSPCRGAGDNRVAAPGTTDFAGRSRVIGGSVDIGAYESDGILRSALPHPVVRVKTDGNDAASGDSWARAKRTIQAAIETVRDIGGGEVWVARGVYPEWLSFGSFTHLYGGFTGAETRREQRDWARNQTVVQGDASVGGVVGSCGYRNSTLDGFTITNRIQPPATQVFTGLALGPVVVRNCTVTGIGPQYHGRFPPAAVVLQGSALFTGNRVIDNQATGIYAGPQAAIVTGNLIAGNRAISGAGVVWSSRRGDLKNNVITGNTAVNVGGGIYFSDGARPVANNTILGNEAREGGAVYVYQSTGPLLLSNNIIAFNSSGIAVGSGKPLLRHNDIYGNKDGDVTGIPDPIGVDGNISVDPLFRNIENEDWGLRPFSPCIDAGDDNEVSSGDLDFLGGPRILGIHVDMGAIESPGVSLHAQRVP